MRYNDTNSFDNILAKIVDSEKPFINQQALGIIISSQFQETSIKFLSKQLIDKAVYNEQASELLPLKG